MSGAYRLTKTGTGATARSNVNSGGTTVATGTLATGVLRTGDVVVASAATLTLGNGNSIAGSAALHVSEGSTVNLNARAGVTETVGSRLDTTSGTAIPNGDNNVFFGTEKLRVGTTAAKGPASLPPVGLNPHFCPLASPPHRAGWRW